MLAVPAQSSIPAWGRQPACRGFRTTCRIAAMPAMTATEKTVKGLLETPAYGQHVRLTGKLVGCPGTRRYLFADDTGEIATRIRRPVSGNMALLKNQKIVIKGELKRMVSGEHVLSVQTLRLPYFPGG
ncbi:MAG: NirD/YgiW/YdeI family stress tolerance protein [Oxalobacter sp.]|nr:NirD/YgiW/YdeI family stress tolerance protein [Oxalobacter sp.]